MQKVKTSQKSMKASNTIVLGVGYCDLQNILKYETPTAYATRAEGWACDLYHINDVYSIVTGYSYDRAATHKLYNEDKSLYTALRELEHDCILMDYDQRMRALIDILHDHFKK